MSLNKGFRKSSVWAANLLGSPWIFIANVFLILVWLASGPLFRFSDTWQLIVNTSTTIITYLAVFLIQNTQNRDAKEIHLKLDELIRSIQGRVTALLTWKTYQMKNWNNFINSFGGWRSGLDEIA